MKQTKAEPGTAGYRRCKDTERSQKSVLKSCPHKSVLLVFFMLTSGSGDKDCKVDIWAKSFYWLPLSTAGQRLLTARALTRIRCLLIFDHRSCTCIVAAPATCHLPSHKFNKLQIVCGGKSKPTHIADSGIDSKKDFTYLTNIAFGRHQSI